jgi:hypothetical protein
MNDRTGGAPELIPEFAIWFLHKIVGHPLKELKQYGYTYLCRKCGASLTLYENEVERWKEIQSSD